MDPTHFYGNRPPEPPLAIRDVPQSDSEFSDIDDSGDEYVLTKDDDEQLRHDLMLDYEGKILSLSL